MAFDQPQDDDEVMSEINMTPLVDVMLVLLVIFIITLPVVHQAVKVDLPQVSSQPDQALPETVQLSINPQGAYFIDKEEVAEEALAGKLKAVAQQDPQTQIYIRGDKNVRYEHVAFAMTTAQQAGLRKIGFVTEAPK